MQWNNFKLKYVLIWKDLAQSLQSMLDYTGDVEKDLLCNFTVGYTDVFGANLTHLLKDNGDNIPVTNKNREVR